MINFAKGFGFTLLALLLVAITILIVEADLFSMLLDYFISVFLGAWVFVIVILAVLHVIASFEEVDKRLG